MMTVKKSQVRRQTTKLKKPVTMMTQGVPRTMNARAAAGVHRAHPPLKELGQGESPHLQAPVRAQRGTLLKSPAKAGAHLQTVLTGRHEMKVLRRKAEAGMRKGAVAERKKEVKVKKREGATAGRKRGATVARKREA